MPDLIRILDIARRALQAHQSAMNAASNNIANVNTEGYSRQRVNLTQARSLLTSAGLLGSGVKVEGLERIRDTFIDRQLQNERPAFKMNEFKSEALHFVEEIFNEPSDFGLNRLVEDFFNSFHDLANDPESVAARSVVKDKALTLANGFQRIDRQLSNYQQTLTKELEQRVKEVNQLTATIAGLNKKIVAIESNGQQDPSLRDQRDKLIDQLSELVDVQTFATTDGALNVSVAGRFLVTESSSQNLSLEVQASSDSGPAVTFEDNGQVVQFKGGRIKGILDIRDGNIEKYRQQLDEFAVGLAENVNALHTTGFNLDGVTGNNLFKAGITGAHDFEVDAAIVQDPSLIAAADAANEPGNSNLALSIAGLQDSKVMNDNSQTLLGFYNSLVTQVGSETQEADFLSESFSLTVDKLELTRDSVSGVSLDEEMTNLIEAQQAFTAASRVVTTVDEMTNTVLNMI